MKPFSYALKQVTPILLSYLFIGIASGLLLNQAGYGPVWAALSALLIYAGSMQIVMVTLMTAGVPLAVVAVTTLLINARHIFYGISFINEFRAIGREKGQRWKYPYMALTLTDETYSVLCSLRLPAGEYRHKVEFTILFLCHMIWIASCTLGAVIGQALPADLTGIDFSATALFTAVVVNQWREARSHLPAVIGFISAIFFYFVLGPDQMILPALSASVVALLFVKKRLPTEELEGAHE
ncbi:MAG: AzlC family ABC transporter permease [Eubacteriales bacterium]|nr:AzlC family ABC transporter permease [Eubacteriales bacterium]